MPHRPSEHMWQWHFLSGFLTLLICLHPPPAWVGGGSRPLQIGITKDPEQSIPTTLCPAWSLVSQGAHHNWWEASHPAVVQMGQLEEGGSHTPRVPSTLPRGRPPKACPRKDGMGNSPLSSPDRGGMDSDGYSMVSKAQSTHHHRRRRLGEKHLAPMCLDMPIFKSTDPNVDVTYTL